MKKAAQILLGTLLIALGAGIPFAALMAVLILPQQFTSIARVIPPQSAFTTVAREIEIIQSARVLDPVVTHLDLCTRFNKVFHSDEPLPPEVCALLLKRDLSVREQKESHLIEIKVVSEDKGQAADIEIQAKEILFTKALLNKYIADYTDQPVAKIEEDCDRDFFMTPYEALDYGIIDEGT